MDNLYPIVTSVPCEERVDYVFHARTPFLCKLLKDTPAILSATMKTRELQRVPEAELITALLGPPLASLRTSLDARDTRTSKEEARRFHSYLARLPVAIVNANMPTRPSGVKEEDPQAESDSGEHNNNRDVEHASDDDTEADELADFIAQGSSERKHTNTLGSPSQCLDGLDGVIRLDLRLVADMKLEPGFFLEGMIVYIVPAQTGFESFLVIEHQGTLRSKWSDEDSGLWPVLLTFTATAFLYVATFSAHSLTHFTMDTIALHLQDDLPKNHVLRCLLEPHMRFTLGVNAGVLGSESFSVISRESSVFAYMVDKSEIIRVLFTAGYEDFRYVDFYKTRLTSDSYGPVLAPYDAEVRTFVREVLQWAGGPAKVLESKKAAAVEWANKLAGVIQGFPSGSEMRARPDPLLEDLIVALVMNATVVHTYEHQWAAQNMTSRSWLAHRIRIPFPRGNFEKFDWSAVRTLKDHALERFALRAFYEAHPALYMKDVHYRQLPKGVVRAFKRRFMAVQSTSIKASSVSQSISF